MPDSGEHLGFNLGGKKYAPQNSRGGGEGVRWGGPKLGGWALSKTSHPPSFMNEAWFHCTQLQPAAYLASTPLPALMVLCVQSSPYTEIWRVPSAPDDVGKVSQGHGLLRLQTFANCWVVAPIHLGYSGGATPRTYCDSCALRPPLP